MKKRITVLVPAALAVLLLAGCSNPAGGGGTEMPLSTEELTAYLTKELDGLGDDTTAASPETLVLPSNVVINNADTDANGIWAAVDKLVGDTGKYVVLDLSGCSFAGNTVSSRDALNNPLTNGMNIIGNNAYIKGVILPSGITRIGNYAFDSCQYLTGVTIPSTVTVIGDSAFRDCSALTGVSVDGANANYSDEGGVLFNKTKTTLLCYPAGKTGTSYVIPNTVTVIWDYAFYGCSTLTSVTIPAGLTSIGDHAFGTCHSLNGITIPSSVTSIGYGAFTNCALLTGISVDSANAAYCDDDGVLFNKTKTTLICYPKGKTGTSYTIPNTVTVIEDYAFWGCSVLAGVTIPAGVTSIGYSAFHLCPALTGVTFDTDSDIGADGFGSHAFPQGSTTMAATT
jgi:outer membrane murein-binding lipoprotein Lpp